MTAHPKFLDDDLPHDRPHSRRKAKTATSSNGNTHSHREGKGPPHQNGDAYDGAPPDDRSSELTHRPIVVCLGDVQSRPVEWLWPNRIALGKLTNIAGDPGNGKSILSIDIAARVSIGAVWPDGCGRAPRGSVVVMSAEDDLEDTIRPRLDAAGADPKKIHALQGIEYLSPQSGKVRERAISVADLDAIAAAVRALDDCRLIIMDPVTCFLGDADSHKNAEVRAALAPLVKLAAERKFAILTVTHLNKSTGAAMYRTMGSLAFVAAARAAYVVARDKDDATHERRLLLPIKNNLGNDKTGLAFRIVGDYSQRPSLSWEEGTVSMSADEALSAVNDQFEGDAKERRRHRTETGWTNEVLRAYDRLIVGAADGTVGYSDVKAAAGLNGTRMDRACFLLAEAGIIEVGSAEYTLPQGGKKERKTIRRLRGGDLQPV